MIYLSTQDAILLTFGFAFLSATSRGFISVIDRFQFGHSRQHVGLVNILNNIITLSILIIAVLAVQQTSTFTDFFFDYRVLIFGLLLQLSANAFSYAFRHMTVPTIIIFSKLSDFFIPLFLWVFFQRWSFSDFLFSAGTFVLCLPLLKAYKKQQRLHLISAISVTSFLILQGGLTPWYMSGAQNNFSHWLPFTAALVAWRFLFSLLISPPRRKLLQFLPGQNLNLLIARAFLTICAQGSLVLALSYERPVLAWPILNSTGLISVVASSLFLNERATRTEYAVVFSIFIFSLLKIILGS